MPNIKKKTKPLRHAADPGNRLNDLDGRSWLKFQKSWFVLNPAERQTKVAAEFILFFTKKRNAAGQRSLLGVWEENAPALAPLAKKLGREVTIFNAASQNSPGTGAPPALEYALIDLYDELQQEKAFEKKFAALVQRVQHTAQHLKPHGYLTIFAGGAAAEDGLPRAWLLAMAIGQFLALKDEKIGCLNASLKLPVLGQKGEFEHAAQERWQTRQGIIYCLNFRREEIPGENSTHSFFPLSKFFSLTPSHHSPSAGHAKTASSQSRPRATLAPAWFIAKPPPREKNVLLHPAKFPETLVSYFLREFSLPGDRVFDPMAGTGSTLLSALAAGRQAYGIELNPQFHRIACTRLENYLAGVPRAARQQWRLQCGDAARARSYRGLPKNFDYILTSPPYWDMLRMKGAETQQKRKQAGLLQFYSDDARDLGNRSDYEEFLDDLVKIYLRIAERLAPGRYMTIIVKNVKKRGKIYPLAWHLALRLRAQLMICGEQFWCQDDQRLSPFGYRYAWVSNTFHHYCLHFRKPG